MSAYIPEKGDFVILSFDPQSGHEQRGRRPGPVISNLLFNQTTGMAIVCPITNTDRGIPFHLPVPATSTITGFVMVEQVKSIDFNSRGTRFAERAPAQLVDDVTEIVGICMA